MKQTTLAELKLLYDNTGIEGIFEYLDEWTILSCPTCVRHFMVRNEYEGVITCPYCAKLVEQP